MNDNFHKFHFSITKAKHVRISTCLIVLVLLLQVFRRLNMAVYIAVLLGSYLYWFVSLLKCNIHVYRKKIIIVFVCYFCFFIPLLSILKMNSNDFITAIIRYGAIMPFIFISIMYIEVITSLEREILKTYCLVIAASAVLMIYQVFFGKISFFSDATERLGFERYGSLLGSTTTYGTISVIGIFILYTYKPFNRFISRFIELLIIIGGVLCLSKSFFINLLLGYTILFFIKNKNVHSFKKRNKLSVVYLLCGILFLVFVLKNTIIGNYFKEMISYTFNNKYNGTKSDLIDRLTTLPQEAFNYYGDKWYKYIFFGQGFYGYSGVLGLPDYPMCHNNYFETILIGGYIYFFIYIFIYIKTFCLSITRNNNQSIFIKRLIPYWLVNMLIGASSIVSTPGIIIFVIIISYLEFGGNKNEGISLHSNMV